MIGAGDLPEERSDDQLAQQPHGQLLIAIHLLSIGVHQVPGRGGGQSPSGSASTIAAFRRRGP
jgi:hypothetical protein